MSTRTRENTLPSLKLAEPFEDLTGLISSDLKVIATALAERASDRLLLSPRQSQQLRRKLWKNLTQTLNETMESLTVERQ
jgi:hypothetical protein